MAPKRNANQMFLDKRQPIIAAMGSEPQLELPYCKKPAIMLNILKNIII